MNKKEELQKLIDAIKKGRADYQNIGQRTNGYLFFKSDRTEIDDTEVCGACAIGFGLLAEGIDSRQKLEATYVAAVFPAIRFEIENSKENVFDAITRWNDVVNLPVEGIIYRLEQIKETL